MRPTLPQHDPHPARRAEKLAEQATRYAFNREHYGALFVNEVAKGDGYDLPYSLRAVGVALEILKNRVKQSRDDWPALSSELHALAGEAPARAVALALERLWRTKDYLPVQRPLRLEGYTDLIATLPTPLSVGREDDDAFFAWRQLAGMAPVVLRRLKSVPDHFALDEAVFARAAQDPGTLAAALAEGRLFVVDYAPLAALKPGSAEGLEKFVYAPIAAFVTAPGGALRPVAIQLGQRPDAPLRTPGEGLAWRMAKVAVNNAEMLFNGLVAHFGRSHLVAEALVCVTHRALAPAHPLLRLLAPHFAYTTAANETARTSIVNPGGKQEYLMGGTLESNFEVTLAAIRAERYDRLGARADLADRGVDDPATLPVYPYRDDGVGLADALQRWVARYLEAYYAGDAEVAADAELRAWSEALSRDAGFQSVPEVSTLAALSRFVGDLLWRVTGYHAVMNYAGHDYASWATETPSALFGPASVRAPSEADLRALLPPLRVANGMLEQMYSLRAIQQNRVGEYPAGALMDPRLREALDALRADLHRLEADAVARDVQRPWSFPYLQPSRVPNSVHV